MSPGGRISTSAAAAQALQGPLDGTWVLTSARGRILYVFQVVDPVGGEERLQAAWREAAAGRAGLVDDARRRADRLTLRFTDRAAPVSVALRRRRVEWSGELRRGSQRRAVTLHRP
ncbi:MAG TPA: hypothetical protein VG166_07660 [Caulobacteraceae bacterium]|nr:hypothetical protein [Caulobacteraceae bacterium]